MSSELALVNARVHTMAAEGARPAEAIAIDGDRIVAVGSRAEIEALVNERTRVIDLSGKTVLPGFIDCHVHFTTTGCGLIGPMLRACTSAAEIFDVLNEALKDHDPGKPLWAHGCNPSRLKEARMPTMAELDGVSTEIPLFVVDYGHHGMAVNAKAWQALAIPPDLQGIEKTSGGRLSGLLTGRANTLAKKQLANMLDDSVRLEGFRRAADLALSVGITTLHALDGGEWCGDWDMELLLKQQKELPVRIVPFFQTPDVRRVLSLGLPRIGGCLWVDGATGQHTAAYFEPYSDNPTTKGILYFTQEETDAFVWEAHRAGLHISRHAIGDAAIEQILWAYEKALLREPRPDNRYRIEHYSYPTEGQLERTAKAGIVPIAAPVVPPSPDPAVYRVALANTAKLVGERRVKQRAPFRRMLDMGILFAAGSDSDVTAMNPLSGIQAFASAYEDERRLTPFEAACCFTVNAAKAGFEERDKGTLEKGKLADLVVLDSDPLSTSPFAIGQVKVEKTMVGGKFVYER